MPGGRERFSPPGNTDFEGGSFLQEGGRTSKFTSVVKQQLVVIREKPRWNI
jgi:hypothetical protein